MFRKVEFCVLARIKIAEVAPLSQHLLPAAHSVGLRRTSRFSINDEPCGDLHGLFHHADGALDRDPFRHLISRHQSHLLIHGPRANLLTTAGKNAKDADLLDRPK